MSNVTLLNSQLETLVDRHGVLGVLSALSFICVEKADHIASNWQDAHLAKTWDYTASVLEKVHDKLKTRVGAI